MLRRSVTMQRRARSSMAGGSAAALPLLSMPPLRAPPSLHAAAALRMPSGTLVRALSTFARSAGGVAAMRVANSAARISSALPPSSLNHSSLGPRRLFTRRPTAVSSLSTPSPLTSTASTASFLSTLASLSALRSLGSAAAGIAPLRRGMSSSSSPSSSATASSPPAGVGWRWRDRSPRLPTRSLSSSSSLDFPPSVTSSTLSELSSGPELFDASHLLPLNDNAKECLRCVEVGVNGRHRLLDFTRADLSATLDLHPRDLRFLDTSMRNLPSILVRRKVIIVNLEMFKALITSDSVLIFDPYYPHVQNAVQQIQRAAVLAGSELYEGKPMPFEFIALEQILLTVCRNLEDRFNAYISSLEPLISSNTSDANQSGSAILSPTSFSALVSDGSGSTLMHLLQLKHGLTSFEVTLRETAGAIADLLENDEDMAEMYLSHKRDTGDSPVASEHGEVEVLLETYLRKVDELENEVGQNVKSITLLEKHIAIRLDTNRNNMMKLELLVSINTLGVTTAAFGAAIFGMNLPSHLEGSPYAFWMAAGLFGMVAIGIVRAGMRLCTRRGIDLLQVEHKEPELAFPLTADPYAQVPTPNADASNGDALVAKLNKQKRLTKAQHMAAAAMRASELPEMYSVNDQRNQQQQRSSS